MKWLDQIDLWKLVVFLFIISSFAECTADSVMKAIRKGQCPETVYHG